MAAALAVAACRSAPRPDDAARMALLKRTYDHLHQRLEKAAASEPLVASAFADRGQVIVAIRSALIEELAGRVAARYLERVTIDLSDLEARSSGELHKETFLGRVTLGEWRADVDVRELKGRIMAGRPRVALRRPDLVEIDLPVDVQPTEGDATLHFAWDSAGLANVVCKDFALTRDIHGRVLPQTHVISGELRLRNTGDELTATPVDPDRRIELKLDLTPGSWGVVEAALRSQDTFGKCGMLMDPDEALARLRRLAARGITIRLPESILRAVSLPAHLQKSARVGEATVDVRLIARSVRVETATLWSSVSVEVRKKP